MDKKKSATAQLREKINHLELRNQELERLVQQQSKELEKSQKRLEEKLIESNLCLQAIYNNVPSAIYQFYATNTGEWGLRYANPRLFDILGLEFTDDPVLLLEYVKNSIHKEDVQSWTDSVQEVVEKQIPWKWSGRTVKPTGEILWWEGRSVPIVYENEIVFDGILTDITESVEKAAEELRETNIALNILLKKREGDKKKLEEHVKSDIEQLIFPYLEKLKAKCSKDSDLAFLNIIQLNLDEITSSFTCNQNDLLTKLTPGQIQIANLIKQGHTTKEIAALLCLSPATVACHRQEIRKRLSLTNKKRNLQAILAPH